jgi:hypothetical protein
MIIHLVIANLPAWPSSPTGWITLGIVGMLVLVGIITIARQIQFFVQQEGRGFKLGPFELTSRTALQPASNETPGVQDGAQLEKIVYVKILHLRDRERESPAYSRALPGAGLAPIYDETLYVVVNIFPKPQRMFKWSVRSSGFAYPHILYPWMDKIGTADPQEPSTGTFVAPECYTSSDTYIALSHFFNGQQEGNRDAFLRTETDIKRALLVLDLSSVPDVPVSNVRAYRCTSRNKELIGVAELNSRVFKCSAEDMKVGEILRIEYQIAGSSQV